MKKLISIILGIFLTFSLFAEARYALLIANGSYKNLGNLSAPVNEARNLKKTLEKLGFSVTLVENGSREKMLDSLDTFQAKLKNAGGIGFFHYGGHGVQVNGKNYLIPVDANIQDENKISTRAVDLDEVMESMQAETNIVILDACRDNPFPASNRSTSSTRGLALVTKKPKNSIIVYSAEPDNVAQDGVFTPVLTEKLLEPKSFTDILMEVRREVQIRTNMAQSPEETGRLIENIYLNRSASVWTDSVSDTFFVHDKVKDDDSNLKYNDSTGNGSYSFGLYVLGNLFEVRNSESKVLIFNGVSAYIMWAELNKKLHEKQPKLMFGSSYSYSGKGISQNDYGITYHNFEIGSAYIGFNFFGIDFIHIYFGIGCGFVWTNHEYKYDFEGSGTQNVLSCNFLLSFHPITLEVNITDDFNAWAKYDIEFMPGGFPLVRHTIKIGCGISL